MIENIQFAQVGDKDEYKFQSEKFYAVVEHSPFDDSLWDWNVYNNQDEFICDSKVNFEVVPDAIESFKRHYAEILANHPELKPTAKTDDVHVVNVYWESASRIRPEPSYEDLLWAVKTYFSIYSDRGLQASVNPAIADRFVTTVQKALKA